MKRALVVLLSVLFLAATPAWQTGKLVDLQRYDTGAGAGRAQDEYCFSVELGNTVYLSRYEPYWRHHFDPTKLTVGDSIEAAVHGDDLLLRKPDGGELKTHISRRERVGKHLTSCAERIQSD